MAMPNVYICVMSKYKKQSHVVYKCDYHIVWVPKYRFRVLTGEIGLLMERDIRMYSEWLGCEITELNVQVDHVHVVVSIPPKVSVSTYMGTVNRIVDFGAFVEIFPGVDGLLHISEISDRRIRDVRDELKEGQQVLVKCIGKEGNKIKLSRKSVLSEEKSKTDEE